MNVLTISGRVGQDAELRTTSSGEKVCGFSLANDIGWGEKKKTQWFECSYWGKRGEAVSGYIRKGDRITVSGEVQLVEFTRKDGTPGSKLAVRVNDLDLAARSEGGGGQQSGGGGGGQYDQSIGTDRRDSGRQPAGGGAQRGGGKPAFDEDLSDEIPF